MKKNHAYYLNQFFEKKYRNEKRSKKIDNAIKYAQASLIYGWILLTIFIFLISN